MAMTHSESVHRTRRGATPASEAPAAGVRGTCSWVLGAALILAGASARVCTADPVPLVLEEKIPLGAVQGRIDHLAYDPARKYLYVAELGNGSVGVVDLKQRRVVRELDGLREPQGVGYEASSDTLYVASAGDGTVKLYEGAQLVPVATIALGEDADNVRVDPAAHRVFVGYGGGALAVIDAARRTKVADIPLKAHPESFQLDGSSPHIFVNIPDAHEVALVDRVTHRQVTSWATGPLRANFPMALGPTSAELLVVFRHPPTLAAIGTQDGRTLKTAQTCADADDVFLDAKRGRIYVSCGEGFIDVLALAGREFSSLGRVATVAGARTSLFAPDIDRLLLAVRATGASAASVWVLRPTP